MIFMMFFPSRVSADHDMSRLQSELASLVASLREEAARKSVGLSAVFGP